MFNQSFVRVNCNQVFQDKPLLACFAPLMSPKTDGKAASMLISPARAASWAMQQPCQVNSNWNWKKRVGKKKEEKGSSCFDCFLWSVTVTLCFAVTLRTRRKTWQCAALLFLCSAFWTTPFWEMDEIEVYKKDYIYADSFSHVFFLSFWRFIMQARKKDKTKILLKRTQ